MINGGLTAFPFRRFAALKIHCSNECRTLLERLGGYQTADRGVVEMKGKGNVRTYWLVGEDHLHRLKRDEFRAQRREQQTGGKHRKSSKNQKGPKDGPRSSLKVPKTTMNGPLSRYAFFPPCSTPRRSADIVTIITIITIIIIMLRRLCKARVYYDVTCEHTFFVRVYDWPASTAEIFVSEGFSHLTSSL